MSKRLLSILKVTFNDHHQLLSNLKDTFYLIHNSDIYYVFRSIIVDSRIKIPLTFAKTLSKEKGLIHCQLSVLINKVILGYISTLT